jgi:hypothetical protein
MTDPGSPPVPAWLDELYLEPGPPFSTMGTRALPLDEWLVVDEHRDRDLRHKRDLLERADPVVFAAEPGSEDAAEELLELVRAWLTDRGVVPAPPAGDEHPLAEAARLVQEDLVVMERTPRGWTLTAGAVCFPTHWNVGDKIGLPLAGIHGPVAHYERDLRARVDRFHDRMRADRPAWRRNWVVVPTTELHLSGRGHHAPAVPIEPDGSPMWIRSERQTLRRLPRTDAIVFTIRVQLAPLGVLCTRPDVAVRMLDAIRSWDREKRDYSSTGGVLDELTVWLRTLTEPDD